MTELTKEQLAEIEARATRHPTWGDDEYENVEEAANDVRALIAHINAIHQYDNNHEQLLNDLCVRVEDEYEMCGLSEGLYADYAKEVAKRFNAALEAKLAERDERLREVRRYIDQSDMPRGHYENLRAVLDGEKADRLDAILNGEQT